MVFKKGDKTRLGMKHTEESKRKIGIARMGIEVEQK